MASRVLTSVPYALVRLGIWGLLFAVALIDGLRHRHIRSRGWQLYAALVVVSGLFLLRNFPFLAIAVEGDGEGWASDAAYGTYIFFSDVAESVWIAVLMAISAGYCITRTGLGPHKTIVTVIPIIFFLTSLVVDYVLYSVNGKEAFAYSEADYYPEDAEEYDPSTDPLATVTPTEGLIFALCAVANSMAFILSWFYMYDTARAEWEALSQGNAPGSQPGTTPGSSFPSPSGSGVPVSMGADGRSDAPVGHSALPANAMLLEQGQNASHLYGDVADQDLDAPKNVQDRIADREKAKLMHQFFIGVCIYVTAAILVFFLPAFVPVAVDAALVIGYDALLWLFVAVMLFVFKMREGNQYLNLTEEGAYDGPEMTTELGILTHDDDDDDDNNHNRNNNNSSSFRAMPSSSFPTAPRTAVAGVGAGAGVAANPPSPKFTLEEEDGGDDEVYEDLEKQPIEDEEEDAGQGSGVNASAAQQGVVVRTLPSPRT